MTRIIPAIDIIDGKCVRLTRGDYDSKKVYYEDPLLVAKQFEDQGFKYLHLVDLDGAKSSHIVNKKVLENISANTSLKIDFGGGIKTDNDIKVAFECGAGQVNCGSIAVEEPDLVSSWIKNFGSDRIIIGADVKDKIIYTHGWKRKSQIPLDDFITDYIIRGATYFCCTDIDTDGTLSGPNIELYKSIIHKFSEIKLIASGGVSSIEDVEELNELRMEGIIIGKALYEGKVQPNELVSI